MSDIHPSEIERMQQHINELQEEIEHLLDELAKLRRELFLKEFMDGEAEAEVTDAQAGGEDRA